MSPKKQRRQSSERRAEAIAHGADLLREGGPNALTSVAVTERMGISQSALYRHLRDMDELSTLSSQEVIADLHSVLRSILLSPSIHWGAPGETRRLCRALIDEMHIAARAFETIDRWQFIGGELGAGIGEVVFAGQELVAFILETQFRATYNHDAPFTADQTDAQLTHARLMHADGFAIARLVRSNDDDATLEHLTDILRYRLVTGWVSYLTDMKDRLGLPAPRFQFRHDADVDRFSDP